MINADLHCHSDCSDGTLAPEAVAALAQRGGVELWSLTDHDTLEGQSRARTAAHALGMDYLCGVEVSVSFIGRTVHIVGLGVDVENPALVAGLTATRSGRDARAQQMAEGLAAVGIEGAYAGALRHAPSPQGIARTHFARFLVDSGVCADLNEVFRRYLTEGRPGYVEHRWAGLGDALRWITGAGGLAVLAHPARYRLSPTEEYALFTEFIGHGGRGVEVVTGSHSAAEQARYADVAGEYGLLASRGSDFHALGESRAELGTLPALPARLTPVWQALQPRVQRAALSLA